MGLGSRAWALRVYGSVSRSDSDGESNGKCSSEWADGFEDGDLPEYYGCRSHTAKPLSLAP